MEGSQFTTWINALIQVLICMPTASHIIEMSLRNIAPALILPSHQSDDAGN